MTIVYRWLWVTAVLAVFLGGWAGTRTSEAAPAPPNNGPVQLSAAERKILEATNKARAAEKLPPLKANALLCAVARKHSANMAKQHQMAHELDGSTPAERITAAGYRWNAVGENVAVGQNASIDLIFKGWMESQHHRENILNPKYEEMGIGLAKSDNGDVYYTQLFGKPRLQ